MPWRDCHQMDERLRFVARRLDGEKMAVLCREFGISRKTGYKIFSRYKDCGLDGLTDRSRRPYRHARQLPFQIEKAIIQLKQEHPSWGAPKIRERLRRKHSEIQCPAISTVHAILDRNGLVKRRRRRRYKPEGTSLSRPSAPNDLWCADYKGEFMLADRRYCYPLTITDCASRYLLSCEALANTKALYAFSVFEQVFKDFGRTHQARPSATERPPRAYALNAQAGSHQAGGQELPAAAGALRSVPHHLQPGAPARSPQHALPRQGLHRFATPLQRLTRDRVSLPRPHHHRHMLWQDLHGPLKINLSQAFAGQRVGVKQVDEKIWLVSFMRYDLGFFDHETCRIESAESPFAAKVLPMSPV